MNFNKLPVFLLGILCICSFSAQAEKAPFGTCNANVKKALLQGDTTSKQKQTPEQITQSVLHFITRQFIAKFAQDSYIDTKIKENDFIDWVNILACVYEIVSEEKNTNPRYKNYALQFYSFSTFMYEIMATLNSKKPLSQAELVGIKNSLTKKETTFLPCHPKLYEHLKILLHLQQNGKKQHHKIFQNFFLTTKTFSKVMNLDKDIKINQ